MFTSSAADAATFECSRFAATSGDGVKTPSERRLSGVEARDPGGGSGLGSWVYQLLSLSLLLLLLFYILW